MPFESFDTALAQSNEETKQMANGSRNFIPRFDTCSIFLKLLCNSVNPDIVLCFNRGEFKSCDLANTI